MKHIDQLPDADSRHPSPGPVGGETRVNSIIERQTRGGRTLYVKQYLAGGWLDTPELLPAKVAREVALVERLGDLPALAPVRLGVQQIDHADPASAMLATVEVPGRSLDDLILSEGQQRLRGTCTRALLVAGHWLRAFQTLSTEGYVAVPSPGDPQDLVEYCDLRLKTLMELGYGWPDQAGRDRVLAWLGQRLDRTPVGQRSLAWSHGDFGPANLIWDGRVLTPIDFSTTRPDLPLVDLTYLIHRLEMLPLMFFWHRWPVSLWRRACLRGFGVPGLENSPLYEAVMARHLLCRLQSLVRRPPKSLRQRCHNFYLRGRVHSKLTRLLGFRG